jgi:2-polyprenyl-6-methoxyphenol hydroxylase-like FAD-dependent oxidoreductase
MANTKTQFHIAIVGAGLGGLAAAISIAQGGHKATILEQATELGEVSPSSIPHLLYFLRLLTFIPSRSEQESKSHPIPRKS